MGIGEHHSLLSQPVQLYGMYLRSLIKARDIPVTQVISKYDNNIGPFHLPLTCTGSVKYKYCKDKQAGESSCIHHGIFKFSSQNSCFHWFSVSLD